MSYTIKDHYLGLYNLLGSQALASPVDRVLAVTERVFSPQAWYGNFITGIGFRNSSFFYLPMDMIIFTAGFYMIIKDIKNSFYYSAFIIWIMCFIFLVTFFIPMDWDRYYFPIVLSLTLVEGIAVYYGILYLNKLSISVLGRKLSGKMIFKYINKSIIGRFSLNI